MPASDRPTPAPVAPAREERLRALLGMRVSELLDALPGALDVLLEHGFAPLAQPPVRRMLAPTVTLEQAIRLRGLPDGRREALLRGLAEIAGDRATEASACR